MIGRLIAVLFLSREVAHREHLKTTSYAHHMALGSFYDDVVEVADSIAEAYQGRYEVISDIPFLSPESVPVITALERQLQMIEKLRYTAVKKEDSAIQNLIDEAVSLYLSTLYKLRTLK